MKYVYMKVRMDGIFYDPVLIKTKSGQYYILEVYVSDNTMERIPVHLVPKILHDLCRPDAVVEITNAE